VHTVQDLIGPILLCAVLGGVVALVAAAALSRLGLQCGLSSFLARLLLALVPIYLAVDYVIGQGAAPIASAGAGLLFGLYCLRGWWAPEYFPIAPAARSHLQSTMSALRFTRPRRATGAADFLRYRMLSVVDADRRLEERAADGDLRVERQAGEGSLAKAA
jgi:hypothetical protein